MNLELWQIGTEFNIKSSSYCKVSVAQPIRFLVLETVHPDSNFRFYTRMLAFTSEGFACVFTGCSHLLHKGVRVFTGDKYARIVDICVCTVFIKKIIISCQWAYVCLCTVARTHAGDRRSDRSMCARARLTHLTRTDGLST